jgi:hypothetical protein
MLLTHGNLQLTTDTAKSINLWVGPHLLIVVDKIGWHEIKNKDICGAKKIEGFYHNFHKSPYRNYALGLKTLYETWPDSDWYCYVEYDVLFVSDYFKKDLRHGDVWCVGCDVRKFKFELPLLEKILNLGPIKNSYYFLGCCHFHHRDFISKLYKMKFFENFLEATSNFMAGYFPDYTRWAFEEELWPTLAVHLGGNLLELACWKGGEHKEYNTKFDSHMKLKGDEEIKLWRGDYETYTIRNDPEIRLDELSPRASIIHPIKSIEKIRNSQELIRNRTIKQRLTLWA